MTNPADREVLIDRFRYVRAQTERLAAPLTPEDQVLQSMPNCSPTKWHRAHTTWFFETFVLQPRGYPPVNDRYGFLFNSYYNAVGPRHARPKRGMISRPVASEVADYRRIVDERVVEVLSRTSDDELAALADLVHLGLAHEEQHQELLLTDIQHAFAENPLQPAYCGRAAAARTAPAPPLRFIEQAGGLREVGYEGMGFAFDNERPRHKVWLEPYALANRLVTVGEMKAFITDRGYETPSLWLSEGLDWVRLNGISAPLYASVDDGVYRVFGLRGPRVPGDAEPVAHLSFYEADAVARYLDARLPTEAEWECAALGLPEDEGNLLESGVLHPVPAAAGEGLQHFYGDVWEWTRSAYEPYPGYTAGPGALGEYNGKFMANQYVLRGGSCFTPRGHVRASYRNFWHPDTRFQVTGVRLARSR